ncbi:MULTISPECIES: hypothetical protein [Phenylobacterium]|uniref:Uncharacterized protein n=1 Tax=Phenylobacterium koreense TaxID=266125 RepID=A0ABV2EEN8_9CAUL|nr:hypothetical protein [Phenylobacterium sp. NIBR 498073]WGU41393.1 hypothetical protein O4N75_06615 [Phenylobacterium sp. NIBR 498073]
MMTTKDIALDARFLAQERIVDALLRALAIRQPELLSAIRGILVDTEFSHSGKPGEHETVHQQIKSRLDLASQFADAHGTAQD